MLVKVLQTGLSVASQKLPRYHKDLHRHLQKSYIKAIESENRQFYPMASFTNLQIIDYLTQTLT